MSMDFDAKEREKVTDFRGKQLVILAGPGTGKTATLVERIIKILASDPDAVVSFITFTRTSRREAERRIKDALSKTTSGREPTFPRIATLYMFAKALIHQHATLIGLNSKFRVLAPEKEDLILMNDVIKDLSLPTTSETLRDEIFKIKSLGNDGESLQESFLAYENVTKIYNTIDIPNLVYQSVKLLRDQKITLPNLYLHVDEYQDLNPMDQAFITQVVESGNHEVVVCGDDEQSIYGFRHAHPEGIRSIWEDSEWEHVSFNRCTRLPPHILRASRKLIEAHKGEHIDKQMIIPGETGVKIVTFQCTKNYVEVKQIAKHIKEIQSTQKRTDRSLLAYKDMMVLCPTNTIVGEFFDGLSQEGIPARKKRETRIPDNVWRLFLLVRLAEHDDSLALRQWLKIADIDENKVTQVRKKSLGSKKLFFECARESSDNDIKRVILMIDELQAARKDLKKMFQMIKAKHGKYVIENEAFRKVEEIAKLSSSATELVHGIYTEYGIIDKEDDMGEEDKVLITTLHRSKGLEAEVVYIVRCDNRFLPLESRDWDEELRSFYVGMTRAKQMLFFSRKI